MIPNYPGAKANTGIQQWLINRIPYHTCYAELFAESGKLFHAKKPAEINIINDIDWNVTDVWRDFVEQCKLDLRLYTQPALSLIEVFNFTRSDFIYLDPPYPASARRSTRNIYRHEMMSDEEHTQLLSAILQLDTNIMISTRQNDLYDHALKNWRKETFNTMDRGGACQEIIYMNYPVPELLHQYNMLGNDFIDRQRIKRKVQRFANKIQELPTYEKHLFIQQLIGNDESAVKHFLSMAAGPNSHS